VVQDSALEQEFGNRDRSVKSLETWPSDLVLQLQQTLLTWYGEQGRKLPWRETRDPYAIWISEIMLQQTQVKTVLPYYDRWLQRFPTVQNLAQADQQAVLKAWEGLGYYARARNLHKAAQVIVEQYDGQFPDTFEAVVALPGIGRTTAGGILSAAFNQSIPILDGNVKRVLARYHGIEGWPGSRDVESRLWQLAEGHTPKTRAASSLCNARRAKPWNGSGNCRRHWCPLSRPATLTRR